MMFSVQSKAIAMLFSVGLIAGCSSTGDPMEDADYGSDVSAVDQQGGSTVYSDGSRDGVSSSQLSEEERMAAQQQSQQMALRDVTVFYFDFDTAEINAESRDALVAHARYLSANPSMNARLECRCRRLCQHHSCLRYRKQEGGSRHELYSHGRT